MKNKSIALLFIVLAIFISCSNNQVRVVSNSSTEQIEKYLNVDKFLFYTTEFINRYNDQVNPQIISTLKEINPRMVLENQGDLYSQQDLADPYKYNEILHNYLRSKNIEFDANQLDWEYNFLKNKIKRTFALKEDRLNKVLPDREVDDSSIERNWPRFEVDTLDPEEQTLNSSQYISDRMTRAIWWDVIENNRTLEGHVLNPREFLKNLERDGGEVIAEVDPIASNYNKIFLVKYPDEDKYRVAITNVGGNDRWTHLLKHIGLSNIYNRDLSNVKIELKGDIAQAQDKLTSKLINTFNHLPKADLVVFGQKNAIMDMYKYLWQFEALKTFVNEFSSNQTKINSILGENKEAALQLIATASENNIKIIDHKKLLSEITPKIEEALETANKLPPSFITFNKDYSVFEIADVQFKDNNGKKKTLRLVSNSWGDEGNSAAKALKATGHKNYIHIGTGGGFAGEVGQVVQPTHVIDSNNEKMALKGIQLKLPSLSSDQYIKSGVVDHVSSPFDEDNAWLEARRQVADYVEIEVGHLRKIFNGSSDKFNAYIMISDILGREGETLASGSASKRKKGKTALLYGLLNHLKAEKATPVGPIFDTKMKKLRFAIENAYPETKKSTTFKYHLFSLLKNESSIPSKNAIQAKGDSIRAFSDNTLVKKTSQMGEVLAKIVNIIEQESGMPEIGFPKEFVNGKWNPSTDKLALEVYANSEAELERVQELISQHNSELHRLRSWLQIEAKRGPPTDGMFALRPRSKVDEDFPLNLYTWNGTKQAGLDYVVSRTGGISFSFLPTIKTSTPTLGSDTYSYLSFFPSSPEIQSSMDELNAKFLNNEFPIQFNESHLRNLISEINQKFNNPSLGHLQNFHIAVELNTVDNLDSGNLAEFTVRFDEEKGIVITLNITEEGLNNPAVVLEESVHLKQIVGQSEFKHPLNFVEILLNAKNGSDRAKLKLSEAEVRMADIALIQYPFLNTSSVSKNYLEKRKNEAQARHKIIKKNNRKANKIRKNALDSTWKTVLKDLDNSDVKLNDLIAQNDRIGVKNLISKYMPWNEMEPTEISMWKNWLEGIGTPNNIYDPNNEILFRGIAGDLVKEVTYNGEDSVYLMSKMLTKNQGSYNRRLRSLKNVLRNLYSRNPHTPKSSVDSTIANLFRGHMISPTGSSLLSTSSLNVAYSFALDAKNNKYKIAAVSLAQNRHIYNIASTFGEEFERLTPLIIFPDEIILYESRENDPEITGRQMRSEFKDKVEAKLGRPLTTLERGENIESMSSIQNTKKFWDYIQPAHLSLDFNSNIPTCNKMMQYLFGED